MEELDFHLPESDSGIGDAEEEDTSISEEEEGMDESTLSKRYRRGSQLEFDDLAELLREAEEAVTSVKTTRKSKSSLPQSRKEPPKKKRKVSTAIKSATVFDLEEPTYVPSKPRTSTLTPISGEDDAFGDAMMLGNTDAADKKARRHTLRFHTSKIESASARRQGARLSLGGDDDVPYRERRKEKEARAQREAQAGKRGQGGDDLDDTEPGSLTRAAGKGDVGGDDDSAEEDADGYYSLVQRQKREQKESKKLAYEAAKATIGCVCLVFHHHRLLTRACTYSEIDEDNVEGPRSLTRAILKNRGLTPRRSKSVRNPRVKKRQKFAKANKVIASQKPVFKPGAGDSTWYGGERSGISTVVKSVRF